MNQNECGVSFQTSEPCALYQSVKEPKSLSHMFRLLPPYRHDSQLREQKRLRSQAPKSGSKQGSDMRLGAKDMVGGIALYQSVLCKYVTIRSDISRVPTSVTTSRTKSHLLRTAPFTFLHPPKDFCKIFLCCNTADAHQLPLARTSIAVQPN